MIHDCLNNIVKPLLQWFSENKRELPWRQDTLPYHVWVSEIMLQQTRIEAVKHYYARFMSELPDIQALSKVEEDALLKLWEGLGYYSRARNLKKAATIIMDEYDEKFPTSYEQLIKLPGIGEYTAGAIASICFQEKVPAVDGNVLRVVARVSGSRENVLLPETKKNFTAKLKKIMPEYPGNFNEALMELGELICLPNSAPDCENCPLQQHCVAYRNQLTSELPVRIKNSKRKKTNKTVLLILNSENQIAIEKREEKGLLSGMYQLPNIDGFYSEKELSDILIKWKLHPTEISFLKETKHAFTHIDWFMKGYQVKTEQKSGRFLWVSAQELKETYPLPTAFRKML